jgi:hypothetical protein
MLNVLVGAHSLNSIPARFRHRVGNLFSPGGFWSASDLPFALDNYVYSAWRKEEEWSEQRFIAHLEKVKASGKTPRWVVCPDVVGDAQASLRKWQEWCPRLVEYGWPIAFVVQDGQELSKVPKNADVIFIGGSTDWKRATIQQWCENFPRTHVARINTYRWLWHCHKCGAESIDGTGWFWQNKREHQDLLDYLAITEGEQKMELGALFPIYEYSDPMPRGLKSRESLASQL